MLVVRHLFFALLLIAPLGVGCTSDPSTPARTDAGSVRTDGGGSGFDAGPGRDSGSTSRDAGSDRVIPVADYCDAVWDAQCTVNQRCCSLAGGRYDSVEACKAANITGCQDWVNNMVAGDFAYNQSVMERWYRDMIALTDGCGSEPIAFAFDGTLSRGASCDPSINACPPGQYCSNTDTSRGVCTDKGSSSGDSCYAYNGCDTGLFCMLSEQCAPRGTDGESCGVETECLSNFCDTSIGECRSLTANEDHCFVL